MSIKELRAFTIQYNVRSARIVTELKLSKPSEVAEIQINDSSVTDTLALWDTGATCSVITKTTAEKLQLPCIGKRTIHHARGSEDVPTYIVNFYLPNRVVFPSVLVSECADVAGGFGAIIGMDIISQGDFSITNFDGKTRMTFCIPSIHNTDYVIETNRMKFAGIHRNDPCPCRSGKKFKKCCGANL